MGMVAILVMWPGPFEQILAPLPMEASHEIWLRSDLWGLKEMFEIDEIWVTLDKGRPWVLVNLHVLI